MPASPLKHSRIDRQLTLFALSRITAINPGRLSMIERELIQPREDEMLRLAKALGRAPADLFSGKVGPTALR